MPEESVAREPRGLAQGIEIRPARTEEIEEMLPLIRAYCEFYETRPNDEGLREMFRTLITEPSEGSVFVARDGDRAVGFATLDWKWSSLKAARMGYLEDLYVDPEARGKGIADALIEVCAERCRELGMPAMAWQTAPDNHRAQQVYNRTGAEFDTYLEYDLKL
ncbi:MAG TPA: GNAT family N-acetyltransferase [Solirubrobacterales bacterium]|nr:GNAT family N-acetyltransferase [Solirubrobacterales bacterium]